MTIRILIMAMIPITGAAVVTFALDWAPRSAAHANPPPMGTTMKLDEFTVSKARITEFGRKLSEASELSRLSICVEEGRLLPRKGDDDATIAQLAERRKAGLTFKVFDVMVEDVLDHLAKVDPRYTWSRDSTTGIINVYPVEEAPLGWMTHTLSISNKTVREILLTDDLLSLKAKNVIFDTGRGNLTWLETRITLESGPIPARQAVNRLCAQLGFRARWEVLEVSPVKGKVIHVLMIHGINVTRPQG